MNVQIAGRMHLRRVGQHCREGVRYRLQHFVIDSDLVRGLAGVEGSVCHDQSENIANATRGLADGYKDRQIGNRKTGAALSGNIRRGKNSFHTRHGLRLRRINRQNLRAWVRAQQRRGVHHSRDAHVVDEWLFAQRLLEPEIARRRLADSVALVPVLRGSASDRNLRRSRSGGAALC